MQKNLLANLPQPLLDEKPIPLTDPLPAVASFDPDMLPTALIDYILDISERQQSPPDFVAVCSLCALSSLLGTKATIMPKQKDDWAVVPNLWGAIVGRPSAMKSPSMKAALAPIYEIQDELKNEYETSLDAYCAEFEVNEIETAELKKTARTAVKQGNRNQAIAILQSQTDPEKPKRHRIIVNDATVEKLGELLNENPNGLLLVRDELSGWLAKLRGEEGQADRAFYLQCFDGDGRFTTDRIGRGTIDIKSTTLSIIGGIQPSKILPIINGAVRGHDDDGLLQRLQLTVWPNDNKKWTWIDRAPNQQAKSSYDHIFRKIFTMEPSPQPFRFSHEAQQLFIDWMNEIQNEARSSDVHQAMESHLIKMPQTIASLALIFELVLCDEIPTAVGATATAMALDWADYLKSHAQRLYSLALDQAYRAAKLLKARRSKLPVQFTERDIQRKGWAGLNDKSAINEALVLLTEHRYLDKIENHCTGGRPSISYVWRDF
jgi:hypothetical protein